MADGDVVHLVVIDLGIAVSKYVSETDYISGVRDLLRDSRSGFVKTFIASPQISNTLQVEEARKAAGYLGESVTR